MKKYITIAALLAAGTTFANATDITFAANGWKTEKNRQGGGNTQFAIDASTNSMSLTNSNWAQSLAYYDFDSQLETTLVSFSFDILVTDGGSFTFTLIGDNTSFVFGKNYDVGTYEYAVATGINSETTKALIFKQADASNKTAYIQGNNTNVSTSGKVSVSGSVDENKNLDLTVGSVSINDINLGGSGFNLNTIGFYGDGNNNTANVVFSDLKVTVVPEPSAFGLLAGLGALALVGARRRRK